MRDAASRAAALRTALLCALLALASSARLQPRIGRSRAVTPKPTPPTPTGALEANALRVCAAGWAAIETAQYLDPEAGSRGIVTSVFGLAQATFEDNIREPAAGFLSLTAPLVGLQAVLLLCLASSAALGVRAEDVSRLGTAQTLTSVFVLGTLGFAIATGMDVADPLVVGAVGSLASVTALVSSRSIGAVDDPSGLIKSDLAELVDLEKESAEPQLANFYRGSTLTGILVGSAFFFSPVSPIALFDAEAPATHMFRQDLGVYIVLLLCPVQAFLFRAARDGALGETFTRTVNTVTGIAIAALVLDGREQVDAGNRLFQALEPDSPLRALIMSGDVSRPQANTTAAFSVGFAVALVYLFQAAFRSAPSPSSAAPTRGRGRS